MSTGVSETAGQQRPGARGGTWRRALPLHAAALLGYLALSIALTWPLALHFDQQLFGGIAGWTSRFRYSGDEEAWLHVWHIWWVNRALGAGQSPFWTGLLYYPDGVQLYVQTLSIPNALLTLPVYALDGPIAAYNSAVLLALALTGYAAFLLARAYTSHTASALVCGALLAFGPFHIAQLQNSHLNLLAMQWAPLYVYALVKIEREAGWWPLVRAAALVLALVLSDWYWALACGALTLAWVAAHLWLTDERGALARRYAGFGACAAALLTPLLGALAATGARLPTSDGTSAMWDAYTRGSSLDLLGIALPTAYHPLWGAALQERLAPISPPFAPSGWYVAAGWVFLALALVGATAAWRTHRTIPIAAGALWVIALGPSLHVAGAESGIPLPYALVQNAPLLSAGRKPAMFAAAMLVLLVPLAALGIDALRRRAPAPRRWIVPAAAAALAAFELWLPPGRTLLSVERPAIYQQLAARPGAVADLPLDQQETSRTLRNQMVHGQPIIGGYIARRPAYESFATPLLNRIGLMHTQPDIVPADAASLAAMQCDAPIRHVVVRLDLTTGRERRALERTLTALLGHAPQPAAGDGRHVRYELPAMPDRCRPFVYLGEGWYDAEDSGGAPFRWAGARATVWVVNPVGQPAHVELVLAAESYAHERPLELWAGGRVVGRLVVGRAAREYRLLLSLAPGPSRLELRAPAEYDAASGKTLSLSVRQIRVYGLAARG